MGGPQISGAGGGGGSVPARPHLLERVPAPPGLEILDELGRGAQAVVYRARRHDATYALKMLRSSPEPDRDAAVAVRREAASLTRVVHPGLARIHDVGEVDGRQYLVMELVEGSTLASLIARGPLDEAAAARVGIDMAGALAAAHRYGLVHRDVKPSNVMVQPTGHAKMIDFGLAARIDAGADGVAGTFSYIAPEQTGMLNRTVDGRSDLYSLGVVLYECLTGRLPFSSPDVGELLRLHATVPAPDARTVRPGLSAGFAAVVAKLLAKDPDDRYQSGDELIADLERVRDGAAPVLGSGPADGATATADALVGRETELADLLDRWERTRAGDGEICLVHGVAGVGKTRLVDELAAAVASQGGTVLHGVCERDGALPLAPLRQAVERHLRELGRRGGSAQAEGLARVRRAAAPVASLLGSFSPALAAAIGDVEPGGDADPEQYALAVAVFLARLAGEAGGLVLHIDDAQWVDAATARILRVLADQLAGAPLLAVVTARDGLADLPGDRLPGGRLAVRPIADAAMARLVAAALSGATAPDDLIEPIVSRSSGSPLMAVEYLRAVVDAGLLYPSWGMWQLDREGLGALRLPEDAMGLVVTRLDGIDAGTRELLVAAAAMGLRFDRAHLGPVCGRDEREVRAALGAATDRRLIGPDGDGREVFLHERIRDALLAATDPAALRALHQRIAEVLDAAGTGRPEDVYAVARHYRLGEFDRDPATAVRAGLAAGVLALSQYAVPEAVDFLETAAEAAEGTGLALDADFLAALGRVYLRAGRFADARQRLEQALALEPEPLRRAWLYERLARLHASSQEPDETAAMARRGLAELGRPLAASTLLLMLSSIAMFLVGLAVKRFRIGFGTATGERRERYLVEASLTEQYALAMTMVRDIPLITCLGMRQIYPANRLGLSPQYIRAQSFLAAARLLSRRARAGARMYQHLAEVAERLGDPASVAYIRWSRALTVLVMHPPTRARAGDLRRETEDNARWLDEFALSSSASILCNYMTVAGHAVESLEWFARHGAPMVAGGAAVASPVALGEVVPLVMTGREAEALERLEPVRAYLDDHPRHHQQRIQYLMTVLGAAVEADGMDELFDRAVADVRRLRLTPRGMWPGHQELWVRLAAGLLARCRTAPADERPARLAEAKAAVDTLKRLAKFPIYTAYRAVLTATYLELTGDAAGALRVLGRADEVAYGVDSPILRYEIARARARALNALGMPEAARQYAAAALQVAVDERWVHRIRWIRTEFDLDSPASTGATALRTNQVTITQERYRRRLDALQQLSLAAVTVLDPRQLARVALDETIRIFGAERAFLFLVDETTGQLLPHAGRDSAGTDLTELTGYSSTLVERVRDSGEAHVLTADSDGRSVGSQSALAHGLRSVMVAPMRLKERLLGVVYLDSRVAQGIFTVGDVDMLVAITSHVAVSLENARAAQLEAAVHAARRQRDLAELMRAAIAEVSSTLEPEEVLHRMLSAVARSLGADSACLLRQEEGELRVAAVRGEAPVEAVGKTVGTPFQTDGPARGSLATGEPVPLPEFLPGAASWIVLPLTTPEEFVGVLLVASHRAGAYNDADVDIVATLAGQAMVSYDKAGLFQRVRQLAMHDPLTGIANRRYLLEQAEQRFADGERTGLPMSALMVDIDHFKKINDTHGHQVGDEVIAVVAERLRTTLRPDDLIGRYGGEEFLATVTAEGVATRVIAERLHAAVNGAPIPTSTGPLAVTISVGVSHQRAGDAGLDALIGRADEALYVAKQQGRNRVVVA